MASRCDFFSGFGSKGTVFGIPGFVRSGSGSGGGGKSISSGSADVCGVTGAEVGVDAGVETVADAGVEVVGAGGVTFIKCEAGVLW
jgi:hypothetical protein